MKKLVVTPFFGLLLRTAYWQGLNISNPDSLFENCRSHYQNYEKYGLGCTGLKAMTSKLKTVLRHVKKLLSNK